MFNNRFSTAGRMIGAVAALTLTACAPVTGGSGSDGSGGATAQTPDTPLPTVTVTDIAPTAVKDAPSLSGPIGVTCPEDMVPTDAPQFGAVQAIEIPDFGSVYVQTGTYTNTANGQVFTIEVTGRNPQVVQNYTINLRVCLEAITTLTTGAEKLESGEPGEATEDFLRDATSEDLAIEFAVNTLPPEQEENFKSAGDYTLIAVIDPSIAQNARHCYRRDGAVYSAKLWMESGTNQGQGKVKGYLNNATRISGPAVNAVPNNTPFPVATPSGSSSRYGLVVTGVQAANRYRVSGAWTVGYTSTPTPFPTPPGGCP